MTADRLAQAIEAFERNNYQLTEAVERQMREALADHRTQSPAEAHREPVDLDADAAGYFEEQEIRDMARTFSTENSYAIGGRWEWAKFTPDQIVALVRAFQVSKVQPKHTGKLAALAEALSRIEAAGDPARLSPEDHAKFCKDASTVQSWCNADGLRRLLATQSPAPAHRTDAQIVEQTEALAKLLMSEFHQRVPLEGKTFRDAIDPRAQHCWLVACRVQELLTDTDPENAVAELEDAAPAVPCAAVQPGKELP